LGGNEGTPARAQRSQAQGERADLMDWEAFYNQFRQPDFIPGYEIQNRLGGGAFGEVYKARKASIGKAYAIKFLKIDDDAQREAVERELEQVRHFASIDHPNLVTIEDLGAVNGVPYLIMGYAGEDTLARAMKRGRLDPQAALLYFVQACRGVLALHDRRLVHFDLKPSNIFLKGEIARVGDYGLSKMMTDGRLTLSFGRGTPQYMAPEMLRNRADHRADLYSLGVILYESVTGKLPFESAVAGTIAVREDDRGPPFAADFPAPLRGIVERCLRVAPDDRYASVSELLEALGVTARTSEAVRLEPESKSRPASGVRNATERGTPALDRGAARTEARQTAAELTRGAVEVARGVWDGLRSVRTTPRSPSDGRAPSDAHTASAPPATTSPPTPAPRNAPAATRTSTETPIGARTTSIGAGSDAPEQPAARALVTRGDGRLDAFTPAAALEPLLTDALSVHTLQEGRAVAAPPRVPPVIEAAAVPVIVGTIPVPPAAHGGWLGTLRSSLALAIEVLVALVRGLVRRASGPPARSAARTIGAASVRAARMLGFIVLLACLGGLVTWVALLLWHHSS
jgi:serine/threonine protein kinase